LLTSSPHIVELRGVKKFFANDAGQFPALYDINLQIAPGDFVVITGKSGAGKTTLLNLIAGLDFPSSGTVLVKGKNLGELSDEELSRLRNGTIGFVFQTFNLQLQLTALENVVLPLILANCSPAEAREKALDALARVGLRDKAEAKAEVLSGGQSQRVALARAIVNDPTLLLADEPTGNLDEITGHDILQLLVQINKTQGKTIVLVTHDRSVSSAATQILELDAGRLV
jgi:putative ABC transport system ATP-binding protein